MHIAVDSQGLSSRIVWIPVLGKKSMFSLFFLRFLGILETCRWWNAIIMTFDTIFSTCKFVQGNSLISHIGPTPLNWSRVQPKSWSGTMFWASRTVLGSKNTVYYQYSLQIHYGNTAKVYFNQKVIAFEIMCQKGHPVKWIQQYSLHSVRKIFLALHSLHFKVSTVTKELKIAFLL